MKIVYLHQYFVFPEDYGTTRSYWISKKLQSNHTVVVITSKLNGQKKLIEKKIRDGLEVIYIKASYDNRMGALKRVVSFIRFMVISSFVLLRIRKVNLVYATSTPLTIAIPAMIKKTFGRVPYIFEVRDLWPEFPIQMGAIKNSIVIKLLKWLEKRSYKKSINIIALSPGMKEGIEACGINPEKITVIPNMSKPDIFFPRKKDAVTAKKFGIDLEMFNVIHFGAMGIANGLEYIIEAAKLVHDRGIKNLTFVFLGDGYVKDDLIKKVKEYGITSVVFLEKQNLETTSNIVNLCEVSIVPFIKLEVTKTNSPNKLFDSLSAGKPIIVNSDGWTKDLIEKNNCGYYVDPDNPVDLMEKLIALSKDSELYKEMAGNSRTLSIKEFDKEKLTDEVLNVVESIIPSPL